LAEEARCSTSPSLERGAGADGRYSRGWQARYRSLLRLGDAPLHRLGDATVNASNAGNALARAGWLTDLWPLADPRFRVLAELL
jgi:hypothetical protein